MFWKKIKTIKKIKFKITKIIKSKDKNNSINIKQRNFRPNIIVKNKKRIGVDRECHRFSRKQGVNEFDC
jgi:hypothetical protein